MASRDQDKAGTLAGRSWPRSPGASLELLDLASLASVRVAAERILGGHPDIDMLVNNAGVMGIPERRTEDGFEMQLAVNHLGHFALSALLKPALLRSHDARVVSVTSTGRHNGRAIDPENPHLEGRYDPWRAYGQSKLANVHFARSSIGASESQTWRRGASSPTLGSRTPICKPEACGRPAAAGANGSSGRPWSGSA